MNTQATVTGQGMCASMAFPWSWIFAMTLITQLYKNIQRGIKPLMFIVEQCNWQPVTSIGPSLEAKLAVSRDTLRSPLGSVTSEPQMGPALGGVA